MKIILVYTPFPDLATAQKIVMELIDKKLIACANITQGNSMYEWENVVSSEAEYYVLMKTLNEQVSLLTKEIQSLHPYDVPAVLQWEVEANQSYYDWIREQLG